MWSVVSNDIYFIKFIKGWRGGLRCMILYHKIEFCITNPWYISITLRFDNQN